MTNIELYATRLIPRVRRRLRIQAAFEGGARAAVLAAAALLVGIYLWRLDVIGRRGAPWPIVIRGLVPL